MTSSRIEPLQVLVVDDDAQMLRTIVDILRLRGYTPLAAPTGQHGLDLVGDMRAGPAIALVDLGLPDMDGIELITRLRGISELTEVVILTGNASVDSAVRAMREQSYDYLVKPVQPEQLLSSLGRAGDRWRRHRAEQALHDSESRLRRIFEHVSDALFITDDADTVIDANTAACDLTGRTSGELRASRLVLLMEPTTRSPVPVTPSARTGEYRVRHTDGAFRTVDVHTAAFAPGLFVHTVRDLTAQRRLEAELHHSQKMDAIGRLAGGVAHDFNNMLTAIICYSELLKAVLEPTAGGLEEVDEIMKAARRAAALTGQLLAFSRKQILQPKILDLGAVVDEVDNMCRRLISEDITLSTLHEEELWPIVADPGQIEQVILNLLVNARDAMPDGGTLRLELGNVRLAEPRSRGPNVAPPGDYVCLTVADSGSGMDDETKSHLFEPFFTTKPTGKGTGLGLSTVYGVVKQTGGHVEVDSELGRGTTFRIYFPRAELLADDPPPQPRLVRHASRAAHILLVEDEPTLRELVARLLTSHGHSVRWAGNSEDALRISGSDDGPLDLVVTDVVMPGMSGRELVRSLRRDRPDIRVLYMSGYTSDDVLHRGVVESRDNLLQKPFTSEQLLQTIARVLAG